MKIQNATISLIVVVATLFGSSIVFAQAPLDFSSSVVKKEWDRFNKMGVADVLKTRLTDTRDAYVSFRCMMATLAQYKIRSDLSKVLEPQNEQANKEYYDVSIALAARGEQQKFKAAIEDFKGAKNAVYEHWAPRYSEMVRAVYRDDYTSLVPAYNRDFTVCWDLGKRFAKTLEKMKQDSETQEKR